MQFTARQIDVARRALRSGQSEASFSRDNAMRKEDVSNLYALVKSEFMKKQSDYNEKIKYEMAGALERMQRESEHLGMLRYESCRIHCAGYPMRSDSI